MTIKELYDEFILSRQLAGLSPKTISDYKQFIQPFLLSVGNTVDFQALSQADINRYLQGLMVRPVSKATRATYIRHVKIFLRWCENEYGADYAARKIRIPKTPKRKVTIYSPDQIRLLFSSVHSDIPWLTLRNQSVIALMYDSGLRQSEVCGLMSRNVSFVQNRLTILGKGEKERIVPLGRLTKQYLLAYLEACPYHPEYVFCTKDGAQLTTNAVKLFITRLSSSLPFDLSSHKLRHNFATNYCLDQYEQNGQVDIYRLMYLMGHEELETTRRYLHHANEIIAARGCISHLDSILSR